MSRIFIRVIIVLGALTLPLSVAHAQSDPAEISFWESVKDTTDPDELDAYIEAYPDGKFVPLARLRIKKLKHSATDSAPTNQSVDEQSPSQRKNEDVSARTSDLFTREVISARLKPVSKTDNRGLLGVRIMDISKDTASSLDLGQDGGALITDVTANSAASEAGLIPGSILLEVNNTPVLSSRDVVTNITKHEAGTKIDLTLALAGQEPRHVVVKLSDLAYESDPNGSISALLSSISNLGLGNTVPKNEKQQRYWQRRAAERGHVNSMFAYGLLLSTPPAGEEKDATGAIEWFRKAANKGHGRANYQLGAAYEMGEGVSKDLEQAVSWYENGVEKNDPDSLNRLGYFYYFGLGDLSKNYSKANDLFEKSAALNHRWAMINLGDAHRDGKGVTKSNEEAFRWYKKAADANLVEGYFRVGYSYDKGRGVEKDYVQAANWYEKAATSPTPHVKAAFNLGILYDWGRGVEKDHTKAMGYYRIASDRGHAGAMNNMAVNLEKGEGAPKDQNEANRLFAKAASQGHALAQYNLALNYNAGSGFDKNPELAAQYFLQALSNGSKSARKRLFEQPKKMSRSTRREVQKRLRDNGVYQGRIDGNLGPSSRRAMDQFVKNTKRSNNKSAQSDRTQTLEEKYGDLSDLEVLD